MSAHRFAAGPGAFAALAALAERRQRITYADFAREHGFGAPIGLSWILMPLLLWCGRRQLPLLPIIVVRTRDHLPSGPYRPESIAGETRRVFAHVWRDEPGPTPDELAAFARRSRLDRRP